MTPITNISILFAKGKCTHDASFSKAVLVGKACQKKVFTISKH